MTYALRARWARRTPRPGHLARLGHRLAAPAGPWPVAGPRPVRYPARRAQWYLLQRGDYSTALDLAETWRPHWLATHGPTSGDANALSNQLAYAYRLLGRYQDAYDLAQATYDTYRRVRGPDHPHTLASASNLASDLRDLGRYQEAYDLDQALTRHLEPTRCRGRRRVVDRGLEDALGGWDRTAQKQQEGRRTP